MKNDFNVIDKHYLKNKKVRIASIATEILKNIEQESKDQIRELSKIDFKIPSLKKGEMLDCEEILLPENHTLHNHKNTKCCPVYIKEVVPVVGCQMNCLYCLAVANNGIQTKVQIYRDYDRWFHCHLSESCRKRNFGILYYLSPKTDIFSHELVTKGFTHSILNAFADHVNNENNRLNSHCRDMLFIPTKAGIQELDLKDNSGQTIIDILRKFPDNVQVCGSITFFDNDYVREVLEPGARTESDRLKFLKRLQENNILASSVMVEPILPAYLPSNDFFEKLKDESGTDLIAIDILSTTTKCLLVINQIIGMHNEEAERKMWDYYLSNTIHQKSGLRRCIAVDAQLDIYNHVIKKAQIANINKITYCRSTQSTAKLPILNYKEFGCMGYLPIEPSRINQVRQQQYHSPGKD